MASVFVRGRNVSCDLPTFPQQQMCLREPAMPSLLDSAARLAASHCQQCFPHQSRVCPSPPLSTLSKMGRETAVLYALYSASLAYTVSKACGRQQLSQCYQPGVRTLNSDNVAFGLSFTKTLLRINKPLPPSMKPDLVQKHNALFGLRICNVKARNSERVTCRQGRMRAKYVGSTGCKSAGQLLYCCICHNTSGHGRSHHFIDLPFVNIEIVKRSLQEKCVCGVMRSCHKTLCYKQLKPFTHIALSLQAAYLSALYRRPNNRARALNKRKFSKRLLYTDKSTVECSPSGAQCYHRSYCYHRCCQDFHIEKHVTASHCNCNWVAPFKLDCDWCNRTHLTYRCL